MKGDLIEDSNIFCCCWYECGCCHVFCLNCVFFLPQGIGDIRIDRKAIPNASRRFWSLISKLPNLLAKGSWKHTDTPMTSYHKLRLETLVSVSIKLLKELRHCSCILKKLAKLQNRHFQSVSVFFLLSHPYSFLF